MKRDDFVSDCNRFIAWLDDYFRNIEKYPVKSQVKPGEIKSQIAEIPPEKGQSFEEIIIDLKKVIIPGITHWQHPSFFAYFPSNNSVPSILAELVSAGLGVQGMVWETSPSATELEHAVMDWLKKMLGLPQSFKGVIHDTASVASLTALVCARERVTDFEVNEKGLYNSQILRVYASDQAHSSIEKGARIAGFGRDNVVCINSDAEFKMKSEDLEKAIKTDIENGYIPACVTATVGTTSSTAIDPLNEIGKVCQKYKVWLHVDAAFAGTAAILPEKKYILNGIEYADSFVFNPHKWMMTNFDCSAFYVKDSQTLNRAMSTDPEYLKTAVDSMAVNYRDWHIQLGRKFRALKLWFVIRHYGVKGLQEIIRNHISWAQEFEKWIDESKNFEKLAPVTLNLVCFRFNPTGKALKENELEKINKDLVAELNSEGKIYLTHTKLKGKYCLRMCIGQRNTELKHVEKAWDLILNSNTIKKW